MCFRDVLFGEFGDLDELRFDLLDIITVSDVNEDLCHGIQYSLVLCLQIILKEIF